MSATKFGWNKVKFVPSQYDAKHDKDHALINLFSVRYKPHLSIILFLLFNFQFDTLTLQ